MLQVVIDRARSTSLAKKLLVFVVGVVGIGAVSDWASGLRRYTWGARFGTFGCGLGVLVLAAVWRHYHLGGNSTGLTTSSVALSAKAPLARMGRLCLAMWLAVLVAAVGWDLLGLLTPPGRPHLTLSAIELDYRPLHALLFAYWLVPGWMLAVSPLHRRRNS